MNSIARSSITSITAGQFYGIDIDATSPDGSAIVGYGVTGYTSVDGSDTGPLPGAMSIGANGLLTWQSLNSDANSVLSVTVSATDQAGLTTTSSPFTITVNPNTTPPVVTVNPSSTSPLVNQPLEITVEASDFIGVVSEGLTVNGVAVPLTSSNLLGFTPGSPGTYTFTPTETGTLDIVATATDAAGLTTTVDTTLDVTAEPTSYYQPGAILTGPSETDELGDVVTVTAPVAITGSAFPIIVIDPDNSLNDHIPTGFSYTLSYAPLTGPDSGNYTTFATGTTAVTDGTLGTFDPTNLPNGTYTILLTVGDSDGVSTTSEPLIVGGNLKLGNYNLSFNDLTVSISGLPITITRSYDTLNATSGGSADFGYGWSLSLFGMNLTTDATTLVNDESNEGLGDLGILPGFKNGTRVYVTMPDGTRDGFTFQAVPVPPPPGFDGGAGQFASDLLYEDAGLSIPTFVPDPGVDATLTVAPGLTLMADPSGDGEYDTADGIPFNPASPLLDGYNTYTLTDNSAAGGGMQYSIDGPTGNVTVQDRNGDRLVFNQVGVQSIAPDGTVVAQISITRDFEGRITQINAPGGQTLEYAYDAEGDLTSFTNQDGNTTTYKYDQDSSGASIGEPHYLTDIIDPEGVDVAHASFNDEGAFTGFTDAAGNESTLSYNTSIGDGETAATAADALGNVTIEVTDSNGNIIRKIQQLGVDSDQYSETVYTFDSNDDQTSESEPFVVTGVDNIYTATPTELASQETYDARGDVLTSTDAYGNVTINTYDSWGDELSSTDPEGNTTTNTYDNSGDLLSSTDPQGNTTNYAYDNSGNLVATTDPLGNLTTDSYNSTGLLTSTEDPNGVTTNYSYNAAGNQTGTSETWENTSADTSLPSSLTLTTSTTYDASGNALSTTDAQDNTTSETYNGSNQVLTSTDALGNVTTNTYDSRGLLIQTQTESRNADGSVADLLTRTVYDADGQAVLTTDQYLEDASTTPVLAGDPGSLPTFATVTEYDALGNAVETYRLEGVVVDLTGTPGSAAGQETSIDANNPGTTVADSTTTTTYNAAGNVATTTDGFGNETINTYDEAGDLVQTAQQSEGTSGGGDPEWVITRTVYNSLGNAIFTTNPYAATLADGVYTPVGDVTGTRTIYDSYGNVIETQTLDNLTIDLDATSGGDGTATASVEPGYTVVSLTDTVYNSLGQTVATIGPYAPGTDPANAPTTNYEYYANGQQWAVIYPATPDAAAGGAMVRQRVETIYGGFDGAASETISNILQAPVGQGSTLPSGSGTDVQTLSNGDIVDYSQDQITTDTYDAFGNLVQTSVTAPGSGLTSTTSSTYNTQGQQTSATDALGNVTNYTYNAMGQLASVSLPAVPDALNGNVMTNPVYTYQYDAFGNQIATTDPNNDTTAYTFDEEGHQLTYSLPLGQTQTSTYDALGRMTSTTSFDGVITVYTYDDSAAGDGRLASMTYYENATDQANDDPALTVTYAYDALGQTVQTTDVTTAYDIGAQAGIATTTDTYDQWGNLTQVTSPEGTINYVYDPVTGEHTETWTGTSASSPVTQVDYTYDSLGDLTGVDVLALDGSTLTTPQDTTYTYYLDGAEATETLPTSGGGVTSTYTYNGLDMLTDLSEETSGGQVLADYHYTVRLDGTRSGATEVILQADGDYDVTTIAWTYDADGRLTGETESSIDATTQEVDYSTGQNYTDTYSYDLASNRVSDVHTAPAGATGITGISGNLNDTTTYTYNANDEMTTQVDSLGGTTAFTYDNAGNQVTSTNGSNVTTYGYDVRNKMVTATINGVETTYVYDDAGNRIEETTNAGTESAITTYYLIDTNNPTGYDQPIEEKSSPSVTPTETYIIGQRVLAQANAAAAISYFLVDGHGSTRLLTNATGVVLVRLNYSAFGNALNFNAATVITSCLFAGDGMYDPATGLYFHSNGRQTQYGVFFQRDPQGYATDQNPISLNRYAYAANDPINLCDPTGHSFLSSLGYFAAGVAVGVLTAVIVAAAAPIVAGAVVASLVAVGVSSTAAAAVVTAGGFALAAAGAVSYTGTLYRTYEDARQTGNWDTFWYNVGTGVGSIGFSLYSSRGWSFARDVDMRYQPYFTQSASWLTNFVNWLGTEPTKEAAAFLAGFVSIGISNITVLSRETPTASILLGAEIDIAGMFFLMAAL